MCDVRHDATPGGVLALRSMSSIAKSVRPQGHLRAAVVMLAVLWVLNSAAICMVTARAEAAMACCPPSDCATLSAAPQQGCCTIQSNPTRPAVSPVVLADHVTDDVIATATIATDASTHQVSVVRPYVAPHAPPGCNSVLRI